MKEVFNTNKHNPTTITHKNNGLSCSISFERKFHINFITIIAFNWIQCIVSSVWIDLFVWKVQVLYLAQFMTYQTKCKQTPAVIYLFYSIIL